MEVDEVNYMIPVTTGPVSRIGMSSQAVNYEFFLKSVAPARSVKLVILDACRSDPFSGDEYDTAEMRAPEGTNPLLWAFGVGVLKGLVKGLTAVEPDPGTVVMYATGAGTTASDGPGDNSPFAMSLARRIAQKPPIAINQIFEAVRRDVGKLTDGEQQPSTYGQLMVDRPVYFTR